MFASALIIERDFPRPADLPAGLVSWLQVAGGFAAAAMGLWLLTALIRRLALPGGKARPDAWWDPFAALLIAGVGPGPSTAEGLDRVQQRLAPWLRRLFGLGVIATALVYGILGLIKLPEAAARLSALFSGEPFIAAEPSAFMQRFLDVMLTTGGACALGTALLPFGVDLLRLRWRRIWALAALTIKEVTRRRVLWVFLLLTLVFLFGTWFIDSKPENQVHSYVQVVYLAIAVLLILTVSLVASFGIPTDVRQQTIHTVVTKPVERYELVLGRVVGLVLVMTLVLAAMAGFSLLYVFRNVDPEARDESMKARVPYTGELRFEGTLDPVKGENVGEEWAYRGYISGPEPAHPTQYAVWSFPDVPRSLAGRAQVPCEFTFAIYRTTIGEINKGVFCTFAVESWLWDPALRGEFAAARKKKKEEQKTAERPKSDEEIDDELAEQFGYYELGSKEIHNYHTQALDLPGGLFRNYFRSREDLLHDLETLQQKQQSGGLSPAEGQRVALLERAVSGAARPPLTVRVHCISRTQFLGMAKYDLYLLDREPSSTRNVVAFLVNFFKGTVGIWFWMCLVIAVAVAYDTYLSGVISWLCVLFLFVLGLFREFVEKVALGANEGGGPGEALLRLFGRKTIAADLEHTTVTRVASGSDEVYRWVMRWFIQGIPDVTLFDFSNFVASGFDVSGWHIAFTLLYLGAYLLPWAVLAYYLIKSREIATW